MGDVNRDFIKILNKSFENKRLKSVKRHEELNEILSNLKEEFIYDVETDEDRKVFDEKYNEAEKEFYKTKMFLDENFQLSAFLVINDVVNLHSNKYKYIKEIVNDIDDFEW